MVFVSGKSFCIKSFDYAKLVLILCGYQRKLIVLAHRLSVVVGLEDKSKTPSGKNPTAPRTGNSVTYIFRSQIPSRGTPLAPKNNLKNAAFTPPFVEFSLGCSIPKLRL